MSEQWNYNMMAEWRMNERITHGRHCTCSACARQDWAESGLAPCGMHGSACPPRYDPWGRAGERVLPVYGDEVPE